MQDVWTEHSIASGDLELTLLPGIGGRLWDIAYRGKPLLFQNPDLMGIAFDATDLTGLPTRSPHFGFPLWGGEKTWIAPDRNWPDGAPHAALDSGPYAITAKSTSHIEMQSQVCPRTHLQIARCIHLNTPDAWTIEHRVTAHAPTAQEVGIWSVMMLDHPATIAVPAAVTPALPVFGTADTPVQTSTMGTICACTSQAEFKIGIANPTGRTLIRSGKAPVWLLCTTDPPRSGDAYAHTTPIEVFNSGDYPYCEAEWHAPLATLAPGGTVTYRQSFAVWSDEDASSRTTLTQNEKDLIRCMS